MVFCIIDSPVGKLRLSADDGAVTSILFVDEPVKNAATDDALLTEAADQLHAYFEGKLRRFDLPLRAEGTEFQKKVWQALRTIPYGQTASYLDIAKAIGNQKAVRAVGLANGKNPLTIVVPCHRVIGANGKLVGYGGGLWRKEWLLRHEGALLSFS
ncbi:MAG TPA: methylated-DNA--[protein]-cysteine S-methyltransferase [Caldithrix abyssi]|uniref:Methylated-DNA--protein-cysteine methyltransferase n=1 Tax=Caldithrix abyssi TaxID=187145 RepID=A0A7V4WUX3_CALAY|nr:methylated-DNA--[protein]-cysteine S-methyltransferase [Caldithrix abyssi]